MKPTAQTGKWLALFTMLWASTAMAQISGVAATIEGRFFGTYDLELAASANSLYANKTKTRLTLAIDGSLCGDGLYIASPKVKAGVSGQVFWSSDAAQLEFSLQTTSTGDTAFFKLSAYGNGIAGADYGTFSGKKAGSPDLACDVNQAFFSLAQANYPALFPGGLFVLTQASSTAFFQYYAQTDTYLNISFGAATARGGKFGATPVALGSVKELVAKDVKTLPVPVTSTPSSFDSYYVGTYNLTLQNAPTFSPIANGTNMNFVITSDNKLCAGATVLDNPLLQADLDKVMWNNANGGYYYLLNLLPNNTRDAAFQQGSLNLYSTSGRLLGTFSGTRTALSADCADAAGTDSDLDKINLMFDLAEQRLPALFTGGPLVFNQKADGGITRYYSGKGITVLAKAGQVYVKGGNYGTAYINAGSLLSVITMLQSTTMPVQLPSALTGTYQLSFAAAGAFSPVPNGTQLDVAITEEGNLCMDGTLYTKPELDLNQVNLVRWKNTQTGYEITLDTAASSSAGLSLDLQTLKGESLGLLSGAKTLLLAKCAGLVGGSIKIDAANQLFALVEQNNPASFPPSALTYNQLSNGSLKRFYPATGVLVTITGDTVQASGGSYGTATRTLGKIDALITQLQPPVKTSVAALTVDGTMVYKQSNLSPISRKVVLSNTVDMPKTTTQADLTRLVQQQLGAELNGTSTYTFTIVTNTADKLEFTVTIVNGTTVAGTPISRNYSLRFILLRQ